jgi:hypothetical protein
VWPHGGDVGPVPSVATTAEASFDDGLHDIANRSYNPNGALARVLVAEDANRVAVAGHHGAVDGLGLLLMMSAVVGVSLSTSVRGLRPEKAPATATFAYNARRVLEAVLTPPSRLAPTCREPAPTGDHLLATALPARRVTTSDLVSATVVAVRAFNAPRDASVRRIVVAVGATQRTAAEAGFTELSRRSAWFRVRVRNAEPSAVRALLEEAPPEPVASPTTARAVQTRAGRLLASRLGSTVMVSNLGLISPPDAVTRMDLYPAAHGRSGVAVGCVTIAATTTITVRARRADHTQDATRDLLREIVAALPDGA